MKALIRYCLLAAILAESCQLSMAALTATHECTANASTSSNVIACSLSGTLTSGGTMVVMFTRNDNTSTVTSVSDGTNTYVATTNSPCQATGTTRRIWTYYFKNVGALVNPTWTVTFGSTSAQARAIEVAEIGGGVSTSAPFDKDTCSFSNSTTVPDPGSTTLTFQNEIILEFSNANTQSTLGSTFSTLQFPAATPYGAQYKAVSNGTWGVSAFATTAAAWDAMGATFTDAVAGGGGPPVGSRMMMGDGK